MIYVPAREKYILLYILPDTICMKSHVLFVVNYGSNYSEAIILIKCVLFVF